MLTLKNSRQQELLNFLRNYRDAESGKCDPPIKKIAETFQLSRGQVSRVLKQMAAAKLIEIEEDWEEFDGDPWTLARKSNLYKVLVGLLLICSLIPGGQSSAEVAASTKGHYVNTFRRRRFCCRFCFEGAN